MDGTPMEGMGAGFQINNIPINMAERIEVYKGVVPVGFGADAIGGVVNIVTVKNRTFVDASYSYGSFNTHRSSVNASHVTKSGILMEINAFQNYSDNSYRIHNAVKDLESGQIDTEKAEDVKRFHDTYHNETVIAKFGLVDKSFADRLVFGFNAGRTYKELQNGVRQDVVFGQKHNRGTNIMPSMVYLKRDFLTDGLNVNLTANYNRNIMMNIDTATYEYNWRGESRYNNGKRGEQSYQESEYENRNWNSTFTAHYKIGKHHYFTLNDVFTSFDRNTRATASDASAVATDTMPKVSNKNVLGAEYRLNYSARWNVSVFAKHYAQFSRGPKDISEDTGHVKYGVFSETFTATGYGIAGTYFWKDFQGKISYEKTYRLPTDSELFGDEELEKGSTGLKAENSNNYNLNISYGRDFDDHYVFIDAGFMLRNTKDYIRRVTDSYSNKYYASHINHGYVRNIGFNGEARYSYKNMISAGVNLTSQNIRDNEKLTVNTSGSSTYGSRIPNIPYFFVNGDLSLSWNNFLKRGNHLSLGYASSYVHSFPLYSEKHGAVGKMHVPSQFSHDLQLAYTVRNGRYNVSVECRNFTNERLYDNFSLQKPGRAFYIKLRYFLN
jgi:outer membrane receptor protein involved in Fe transport